MAIKIKLNQSYYSKHVFEDRFTCIYMENLNSISKYIEYLNPILRL